MIEVDMVQSEERSKELPTKRRLTRAASINKQKTTAGAKSMKRSPTRRLKSNANLDEAPKAAVKGSPSGLATLLQNKSGGNRHTEEHIKKALQANFLKTLKAAQAKHDLEKKKKKLQDKTQTAAIIEPGKIDDDQQNIFQQILNTVQKTDHIEIVEKKGDQAALSKASNQLTSEALEQLQSAQVAAENDRIYGIKDDLDFYTKQLKRRQQRRILSTDATKTMTILSKEFKMVNYQASLAVSRENQKHIVLFSEQDAQNSVQEIMSSKLNAIEKSNMPSRTKLMKIDVV